MMVYGLDINGLAIVLVDFFAGNSTVSKYMYMQYAKAVYKKFSSTVANAFKHQSEDIYYKRGYI